MVVAWMWVHFSTLGQTTRIFTHLKRPDITCSRMPTATLWIDPMGCGVWNPGLTQRAESLQCQWSKWSSTPCGYHNQAHCSLQNFHWWSGKKYGGGRGCVGCGWGHEEKRQERFGWIFVWGNVKGESKRDNMRELVQVYCDLLWPKYVLLWPWPCNPASEATHIKKKGCISMWLWDPLSTSSDWKKTMPRSDSDEIATLWSWLFQKLMVRFPLQNRDCSARMVWMFWNICLFGKEKEIVIFPPTSECAHGVATIRRFPNFKVFFVTKPAAQKEPVFQKRLSNLKSLLIVWAIWRVC